MYLSGLHISKQLGSQQVLRDLGITLEKCQTLSILGRSGCGKTTLLKTIAGLLSPDSGTLSLEGKDLLPIAAHKRNIIYLYQEALLFPHLNVFENLAFGLRIRKAKEQAVQEKVKAMLTQLDLQGQEDKRPEELSGGQKQRVNFGRALIINPSLLLLDEPFGNLDVETRSQMQSFFKQVADQYQISSVFVTHDLKEALLMGDQIAYMDAGQLHMYASHEAFIEDPRTGVAAERDFWQKL